MHKIRKVAVVTGAKKGIGLAIAKALLDKNYIVVLSGRDEKSAMQNFIVDLNMEHEGKADYQKCDISKSDDRHALVDYVYRIYGRVDLLVNNAGVAPIERVDVLETTEESFDYLYNINTKGTFFMCQAFANKMIEIKADECTPRIINISSISSYTVSTARGEYCVSKAGLSMTTQIFASRLASEGIFVFEIRPGVIETDMTKGVNEKYQKLIKNGLSPIARMGQPQDVANAVLATATGLLDFGTGTVINADGGFHIRRL